MSKKIYIVTKELKQDKKHIYTHIDSTKIIDKFT